MKRKLPTYKMPFKRRAAGKTDYHKRLTLLKSKKPRLVVRKSLRYITAHLSQFDLKGDVTMVSATSRELKKLGWKFSCDSTPAAYLVGLLVGKKAKAKKVGEAILDSGLYPSTKGSRIYAVVKGAVDAGLDIPVSEDTLPADDRVSGEHLAKFNDRFESLPENFKAVKQKILGG